MRSPWGLLTMSGWHVVLAGALRKTVRPTLTREEEETLTLPWILVPIMSSQYAQPSSEPKATRSRSEITSHWSGNQANSLTAVAHLVHAAWPNVLKWILKEAMEQRNVLITSFALPRRPRKLVVLFRPMMKSSWSTHAMDTTWIAAETSVWSDLTLDALLLTEPLMKGKMSLKNILKIKLIANHPHS